MMILTRESDVAITLIARKNMIKMQKFERLIMFRVIFEKSKKFLKLKNF